MNWHSCDSRTRREMKWHCTKRRNRQMNVQKREEKKIDSESSIWHLGIKTDTHRNVCHVRRIVGIRINGVSITNRILNFSRYTLRFDADSNLIQTKVQKKKIEWTWKSNERASARTRERVRKAERKWYSIFWNCGWVACRAFTNGVYFSWTIATSKSKGYTHIHHKK